MPIASDLLAPARSWARRCVCRGADGSWRTLVEVWCQASGLAGVLIKMMLAKSIQHRTRHGTVAVVPHPTAL